VPSDRVTVACAEIIANPGPARDRLTVDLFHPPQTEANNGIALLERAFAMTVAVQPIRDRMRAARVRDIDQAVAQRTISTKDAATLKAAAEAVAAAIAVNDFAPEELTSRGAAHKGDVSSQPTMRTTIPPASTLAPSSRPLADQPPPEQSPSLTTAPGSSTLAQASQPRQQASATHQAAAETTAPAASIPAASQQQPADQTTQPERANPPTIQPASTPVPSSHQQQLPAPEPVQALPPPQAPEEVIPLPPPPSAEAAE
jgi:hypothetical protein